MILKIDLSPETFLRVKELIEEPAHGFYIEGLDSCHLVHIVEIISAVTPVSDQSNISVTFRIHEKFGSVIISRTIINNLLNAISIFPQPKTPERMFIQ